jgi:3-oxoacyl-[acyl-carrier protein] reductase
VKVLDEKVALVTGASRGIGREICLALAEMGAAVVGLDVMKDELQGTMEEISTAHGVRTGAVVADVCSLEEMNAAAEQVLSEFGRVDILVNNAGITRDNLIIRMGESDWDKVLAVNLKGAFNGIKAVARPMMKQRAGKIVNIASVVGVMGNAGQANYSASKAGLIGLTKTAAREFASRGINVNAVAPGYIVTAMTEALPDEAKKFLQDQIPLKRLGEARDVANAVAFLCAPASDYITGQVIHVNGGMLMC